MRSRMPVNGAALRHIRQLTGLSITALAREIGVTRGYVSNLETGNNSAASPAVFKRLCLALHVVDRRALMANITDTKAV